MWIAEVGMLLALVIILGLALLEILAVYRESRPLEYFAKPGVMIALFLWLALSVGLSGPPLWFGLGLVFSLVGDVFLIRRDRFLVPALVFFLLAHLSYLVGFNIFLPSLSIWSIFLAIVIGLSAARLLRRILTGLHASGQSALAFPVTAYGLALTLMLLSALLTLSNTTWGGLASILVALGAALFFLSDNLLAWDKFVAPISRARFKNIIAYELAQILLIAGVVLQFTR